MKMYFIEKNVFTDLAEETIFIIGVLAVYDKDNSLNKNSHFLIPC